MKGLLILSKHYKKHLSKINIWPSFESWKAPKNHEIGPISNIDSVKSTNPKAIAIYVNYKMICNLNVQSISNKNGRSYTKPAKSVKNALFLCTHFKGHFGWSGTIPQMFSLSGTCSEFIFKKDQWMPVIFLRLGIFKIGFEKSYGELKK